MYTVCTESMGDGWTTNLLFEAIGWADVKPNTLVFEGGVLVAFNCGHTKRVRAARGASPAVLTEIENQKRGFFGMAQPA